MNFLSTKIVEEDIVNIWFQQECGTYHTAEATLDVLCPVFEVRIISRRANIGWSYRTCDLTTLDYYLWGIVKDKFYLEKIREAVDNVLKLDYCILTGCSIKNA